MYGDDYVILNDSISTAKVHSLRINRLFYGIIYSLSIPFVWGFILKNYGRDLSPFYISWILFLLAEQGGGALLHLFTKWELKKLYIVCSMIGCIGAVFNILCCLFPSVWLLFLGRFLQGFNIGSTRQIEVDYIDDILYAKEAFYAKRTYSIWESSGMLLGALFGVPVFIVFRSVDLAGLYPFEVISYCTLILSGICLLIGFKIFPHKPLYTRIPLGQEELFPLLGAFGIEDYFKILRRDYIQKYKEEENFAPYSWIGVLLLLSTGFWGDFYISYLWSTLPRVLYDKFDDATYILLFAGVIVLRLIAILVTGSFTVRTDFMRNIFISLILGILGWLSIYLSQGYLNFVGLYIHVPLAGIAANLLTFASARQFVLVIGHKQPTKLLLMYSMSKMTGCTLSPLLFWASTGKITISLPILSGVFLLQFIVLLLLREHCEEHESSAVQNPGNPIRPLKYPNQVRKEISASLLCPRLAIPHED